MIRVVHPGSRIRMLTFYPSRIPDPGVKKAPDPGSATLLIRIQPKIMGIRIRNPSFKTLPCCIIEDVFKRAYRAKRMELVGLA
jgi:hypothetical protein